MLLVMDALLKKKIESCRRDIRKTYNQECNRREVKCEVCGCRVKKCNWLRSLGTKKHLGVQNGHDGRNIVDEIEREGGRSWTVQRGNPLLLLLPIFPYFSWFSVSIWRRRWRFFWFSFWLPEGWKMRLALACAVAQGADVFLLDEPTNHLDSVASRRVKMSRVCGVLSIPKWADQTFSNSRNLGWLSHWLLGFFLH